jgi:hypothetical protein
MNEMSINQNDPPSQSLRMTHLPVSFDECDVDQSE